MKKLTLFEIELKCDLDQYDGYVAAGDYSEAVAIVRKQMITDYIIYWEEEGRISEAEEMSVDGKTPSEEDLDKIFKDWTQELENARLTKLIEVGEIVVPS